jgi:hypothetical protein
VGADGPGEKNNPENTIPTILKLLSMPPSPFNEGTGRFFLLNKMLQNYIGLCQ